MMRYEVYTFTIAFLLVFISIVIASEFLLPYSYILTTITVAILLVLTITNSKGASYSRILALVTILAIVIRNIYTIRTSFIVEPLYDGYKEIVTARIFNEIGRALVFNEPLFDYTSSYPLLKILTIILSQVTSIDVLKVALILPSVWSLVMLLFFYLFAKTILQSISIEESIKRSAIFLSLLLFSISPDAIYYGMIYYMRFYCITLVYIVLYLLFSGKLNETRCKYLLVILLLAIPLSYSLFPYLLLFFLTGVFSLGMVVGRFFKVKQLHKYIPSYNLISLTLLAIFLASSYYVSESVLGNSMGLLNALLKFLQLQIREPILETQLNAPYFIPEALQNSFNILVFFRDLIIYAPAVIGFLIFLYKSRRERIPIVHLTIIALITILLLHVIIVEGMRLAFQTTLIISLYFIILLSALSYAYGLNIMKKKAHLKSLVKVTIVILLMLAIITAYLSPWSHRFLTQQYYNPNLSFKDVGDHNPAYVYVKGFIKQLSGYEYLFTDDFNLASIMIIPNIDMYFKIQYFTDLINYTGKGQIYVLELNGFQPILGPYGWQAENLQKTINVRSEIKEMISNFNKILSSPYYNLYAN
jgi:hypothetical protein